MIEKYLGASPRTPFGESVLRGEADSPSQAGTVEALGDRIRRLTCAACNLREEIDALNQKLFGFTVMPDTADAEKIQSEPMGEYSRLVQKTNDLEKALEQCCATFSAFRAVFQ